MSSTISSSASPSSSNDPYPGNNNGISAATYYGAVALAIFVIAAVTVASRIMYTRRLRAVARYNANNSADMTVRRSDGGDAALPGYSVSLPNRAHTRRQRAHDLEEGEGLPAYEPAPPKYIEAFGEDGTRPSGEGDADRRASTSTVPAPVAAATAGAGGQEEGRRVERVEEEGRREDGEQEEAERQTGGEDFIHPEERRRNEAAAATNTATTTDYAPPAGPPPPAGGR